MPKTWVKKWQFFINYQVNNWVNKITMILEWVNIYNNFINELVAVKSVLVMAGYLKRANPT